MAYRTTTILHPQYGRATSGRILQPHERPALRLTDYVTVPTIATYGVWSVQEILPSLPNDSYPGASISELASFIYMLEQEGWR